MGCSATNVSGVRGGTLRNGARTLVGAKRRRGEVEWITQQWAKWAPTRPPIRISDENSRCRPAHTTGQKQPTIRPFHRCGCDLAPWCHGRVPTPSCGTSPGGQPSRHARPLMLSTPGRGAFPALRRRCSRWFELADTPVCASYHACGSVEPKWQELDIVTASHRTARFRTRYLAVSSHPMKSMGRAVPSQRRMRDRRGF